MMQCHGERRMTPDHTELKTDLHFPYMGTTEERTLYVRNVPDTWDKWRLFHIFQRFGRIDSIKIIRKHDDSLTYAFVHMMSVADANSVMTATAHNNGKILLPELLKPLKIQFVRQKRNTNWNAELSSEIDKEAERMKSCFSIDKPLFTTGGNTRKHIIYSERFHRHAYLPLGMAVEVELIKPITDIMHWPMTFYVLTKTHLCEEENLVISNEELDSHIIADFERASHVTYVVKNELLLASPKEPNKVPLRCRVLEVLNDNNVRIYALDLGQTFVVEISELKIISDYLASVPARATPCVLYGITNPTPECANVAGRILECISHLVIVVVSFEGAIAFVRAFTLNGSSVSEISKTLSARSVCEYKPPSNYRQAYPREEILALRKQKGVLSIPNLEVADAILVKPRSVWNKCE